MDEVVIRPMEEPDLDTVARMEKEIFPLPFSLSLFRKFLKQDACHSWVAACGPDIVGYTVYSYVIDEADLLNIAVDKAWRRKRIGTRLMQDMIDHVVDQGGKKIFLDVRPSNRTAINFYRKFGFYQIGMRPAYYYDSGEDALVFVKEL